MTPARVRHPGELRWETRLLAVVTLTLVAVGIAACYAAGSYSDAWFEQASQQVSGALIGGIAFLVAARIDYRILQRWARPLFHATVAGLVVIAIPAVLWRHGPAPGLIETILPSHNGARRWIFLGVMSVQVSEIARFTLPVLIAAMAADLGTRVRQWREGFVAMIIPVLLVAGLVAVEPNLSMAILLVLIGVTVAFIVGVRISHLLLLGLPAAAAAGAMVLLTPERLDRLNAFLQPASKCVSDNQVCESLIGLGHGGLIGVGFGRGTQKLGHLAYAYSDFILSVVGEEWGFVGVLFLVVCFGIFCAMGFRIARTARDPFGTALAGGLTAMVGTVALLHAAVVLKLMPATGLTLPFISAGRVSLVIYMLSAGVLVSIGRRRGKPARRR